MALRGAEGDRPNLQKQVREAPAANAAQPPEAGSAGKPKQGMGVARGPGDSRPRPPAPRRGGGPNAGRRKAPVPAGHTKPHPYDKPRSTKNGAAEFTRRAVARALQEGTRARTSGGAARRGSDVGGRQPDPGSPRLPDVRARRLLTQWSRRADVRGCRHEMDFRVMSRRTSLLCRECTLLVLDRNKRRCSTRR